MKSKTQRAERTEMVRIAEDQTIAKKRYNHLTNPGVIISLLVALFGIGATRGTLNSRINQLENFQKEIDMVELQSTLASIQKDIEWIKINLNSKK